MKSFDGYSIRGIVFTVLGLAGITVEIIRRPVEPLIIILYGLVIGLGMALLFRIKSPKA